MTTSIDDLKQDLERQRQLAEAAYALHSTLDLEDLLGLILSAAIRGVGAERGTVFLLDSDKAELWSRIVSQDEALEIRVPLGQGIAGSVAESGDTVRIDDAYEDERFDSSWDKKSGFRTREMLAAPIRNRDGEIVGVFQLLNKKGGFDAADEAYLASLSINAALAVENAQLHSSAVEKARTDKEIALAQQMQRMLQPERRIDREGRLFAAGINELCEDASGDYYDVLVPLPGGRVGMVMGDVSGHGLTAALVMSEARAFLRAYSKTEADLPTVVGMLNESLSEDLPDGKFLTLFVAAIDPETGETDWCNAGHNPPFLYRAATGEVETLGRTGLAVGFMPEVAYRAGDTVTLESGDVLLLYTDGITEANRDGELFGEERLQGVLEASAEASPPAIVAAIREAVRDWTHDAVNDDDLTILVVTRTDG